MPGSLPCQDIQRSSRSLPEVAFSALVGNPINAATEWLEIFSDSLPNLSNVLGELSHADRVLQFVHVVAHSTTGARLNL